MKRKTSYSTNDLMIRWSQKSASVVVALLVAVVSTLSQERIDSRGRDFWFTFLPNFHNNSSSSDTIGNRLFVFVAATEATKGKIDYRNKLGVWKSVAFSISNPSDVYVLSLPTHQIELDGFNSSGVILSTQDKANQCEVIAPQVFHVTTDLEVSVYALNQAITTSEAFLVMPTDAIGKDYTILSYNSDGSASVGSVNGSSTPSEFAIVATEDATTVTIIPRVSTFRFETATKKITLKKGDVYLVQARISSQSTNGDLTGSRVSADKPIAVFAGHQRARIPITANSENASRDHLCEQMIPMTTWGKSAIVVPFAQPAKVTNEGSDKYRVLASENSTVIFVNGTARQVLNAGEFFSSDLTEPNVITSDKPILVAAYKKTSNTTTGTTRYSGDPLMLIIPPAEQFMRSYRFFNAQTQESDGTNGGFRDVYDAQYITIVAPNTALAQVTLDGIPIDVGQFRSIPRVAYSYANLRVADRVHSVYCPQEIGLYVYGYGYAVSYGYTGGMSFDALTITPPKISSVDFNCDELTVTISDGQFPIKSVFIESDVSENVQLELVTALPSREVTMKLRLIDKSKPGKYVVRSTNTANAPLVLNDSIKSAIQFSSFSSKSDLSLNGSALLDDATARLVVTPLQRQSVGSVWAPSKQRVSSGFTTEFRFRTGPGVHDQPGSTFNGGEGIAFVIQNNTSIAIGSKDDGLGYDGISNSLAIEFDTFNSDGKDTSINHCAVQTLGTEANSSSHLTMACLGINSNIPTILPNKDYFARVDYSTKTKELRVFLDTTNARTSPRIVITNFDISKTLSLDSGKAFVGFTGSTGFAYQRQEISEWSFCSVPLAGETVINDVAQDDESNSRIRIYPNPITARSFISITSEISETAVIKVVDQLGRVVVELFRGQLAQGGNEFQLGLLATGMYFVVVETNAGSIARQFQSISE